MYYWVNTLGFTDTYSSEIEVVARSYERIALGVEVICQRNNLFSEAIGHKQAIGMTFCNNTSNHANLSISLV